MSEQIFSCEKCSEHVVAKNGCRVTLHTPWTQSVRFYHPDCLPKSLSMLRRGNDVAVHARDHFYGNPACGSCGDQPGVCLECCSMGYYFIAATQRVSLVASQHRTWRDHALFTRLSAWLSFL